MAEDDLEDVGEAMALMELETLEDAPATAMVPQPPPPRAPQPPQAGRPESAYQARMRRARSSNSNLPTRAMLAKPKEVAAAAPDELIADALDDVPPAQAPAQASSSEPSSAQALALSEEEQLQRALEELGLGDRAGLADALIRAGQEPIPESAPRPVIPFVVEDSSDDDDDHGTSTIPHVGDSALQPSRPPVRAPTPPPPIPPIDDLSTEELVRELQRELRSQESNVKRLLVEPTGLQHEVQCDILRVGQNTYQCFLRLYGRDDRRVCLFEASRSHKGWMCNPEYRITLPTTDARMLPAAESEPTAEVSAEARDAAVYCGRMRSYTLSGADYVAYDDGAKPDKWGAIPYGVRPRRQMAAMRLSKSAAQEVLMRMLVPTPPSGEEPQAAVPPPTSREEPQAAVQPPTSAAAPKDMLDRLRAIPLDAPSGTVPRPRGTNLLEVVLPQWSEEQEGFESVFAGRARCASNKNLQLADVSRPDEAALQVGKLRPAEFNLDFSGCVSPFQAFAAALAVFDNSSLRRRF